MKKIICFAALALVLGTSVVMLPAAWAQTAALLGNQEKKPVATTPGYVAMLFFKLSRQIPPFESWARLTPDYLAAPAFERPSVKTQQAEMLKNDFNFMTVQEPLVIETPVKISEYSATNKGFFIDNFRDDTFFPVTYDDKAYAVVPQGIMDKQWLSVPDQAVAAAINAAARNNEGRMLTMVMFLTPAFADKKEPVTIDKNPYWVLLTDIKNMALYNPQDNTLLWESDNLQFKDAKHQELLQLYQ